MGIMTKHLQRDSRTGRLSFRRAYPPELREFIPKQPRELKRSLGATSLHDPEAAKRFSLANAEYDRTVEAARLKAEGTSRPLRETDLAFLTQTHAHRLRKNLIETHYDLSDENRDWLAASAWRYAPFALMDEAGAELAERDTAWTNSERVREALPDLLGRWLMLRADGDRQGIIQAEGQTAEDLLSEFALDAVPETPLFFDLCRGLLAVDLSAAEQLLRLVSEGDDIETVDAPEALSEPEVSSKPRAVKAGAETMDQLAERLFAQKADPISKTTEQGWRSGLRFWRGSLRGYAARPHYAPRRVRVVRPTCPTSGGHREEIGPQTSPRAFGAVQGKRGG